ncbi:inactive pancreatic lipase-related protein 1-like [Diorhabda sublineata]|uniref:inactive pancreatic lipase-related protein 1-like n=1 Tax=Diorhabda sublineata TaxID=1163346 RepID=UPI0024E0A4D0|nr:inactive pancreatic lipase-related protein 1-like [Diorhabda sublineata]
MVEITKNILFISISVLVISGGNCHVNEAIKKEIFNIYKGVTFEVRNFTNTRPNVNETTYTLYNRNEIKNGTVITSSNLKLIEPTEGQIIFIVHGWTSSGTADWVINLKDAFLITKPKCSVITVDWGTAAGQLYSIASANSYSVGNFIGEMIIDLIEKHNVDIKKILLIGHSLGGHTCGFAGKKLKEVGKLLPRIIALDPAGPLFQVWPKDKRLDSSDADIVEVLHTDAGTFGLAGSVGTIDFFANGGQFQPGCARIDLFDIFNIDPVFCDHGRSHSYFIEAILNPADFLARKCSTYNLFKKRCQDEKIALGNLTTRATGNFYFDTNKEPPYSKQENSSRGLFGMVSKVFKL